MKKQQKLIEDEKTDLDINQEYGLWKMQRTIAMNQN